MRAGSISTEADAVIAALDVVADYLARRERRFAMRAAIRKRGDAAVLGPKQHYRLVADGARERLVRKLRRRRGRVPLIAKEFHDIPLSC
jgi:hypothetical protein